MNKFRETVLNTPEYKQPEEWELFRKILRNENIYGYDWEYLRDFISNKRIFELIGLYKANELETVCQIVGKITYEHTLQSGRFIKLRSGKLVDTKIFPSVPDDMYCCDVCGYIYDGFAQCQHLYY